MTMSYGDIDADESSQEIEVGYKKVEEQKVRREGGKTQIKKSRWPAPRGSRKERPAAPKC